jgi:hypothetical protein
MTLTLSEWETFYVITGSSGAGLTGLMFVVIALAAERLPSTPRPSTEMSAFSTPTVIHFSVVLLVAALMAIPHQTVLTLGVGVGLCAVVGLIFNVRSIVRMHKLQLYVAVMEDWIWHATLPFVAYAILLAAALLLGASPDVALYMVAGVMLFLLFIGIHNAWDVALYTATYRRSANPPAVDAPAPPVDS